MSYEQDVVYPRMFPQGEKMARPGIIKRIEDLSNQQNISSDQLYEKVTDVIFGTTLTRSAFNALLAGKKVFIPDVVRAFADALGVSPPYISKGE